jgi:anti-anti-sigma factor
MAFTSNLDIVSGIARITLAGELDAAAAPQFRAQVEAAARAQVKRLVLLMQDLTYMASAGLRALAFARQKIGAEVDIYMVGCHESILETLTMTGFHNSVILLETYDPQLIETV